MSYALGVDLGTTYTAAAVCRGALTEVVPLGDRAPQVPSVVFKPVDGPLVFGEAAARHAVTEPLRIAREFKRRLGDRTEIYLAGTPMSATGLSRTLLSWVVDQVIAGQGGPPSTITVSCPANWGPFRRELMDQVLALNVDVETRLCTEPEAAAIHYAQSGRLPVGSLVAVYDLGGGTFDAAVLRRSGDSSFELIGAPEGIEQLGGMDFDHAVLNRVLTSSGIGDVDTDDPTIMVGLERLQRDCVEAKEALSSEVEVSVPVALGDRQTSTRLTRAEFEDLIRPLIDDTADSLTRAVRRAGLKPADLQAVVIVGGSARIPLVSEVVSKRLERPVTVSSQPKLCVAMGAALMGAAAMAAHEAEIAVLPTIETKDRLPAPPPVADEEPATEPGPAAMPPPPASAAVEPTAAAVAPSVAQPARPRRPLSARTITVPQLSRPTWYRLVSLALAAVAVLLAALPVGKVHDGIPLQWSIQNDKIRASVPDSIPEGTKIQPTLLGVGLLGPAEVTAGQLDLKAHRLFLSGSLRADVGDSGQSALLVAPPRFDPSRFLTIPGIVLILGALFSFAYAESILRAVRRRGKRVSAGEMVGMVGTGVVSGLVLVLFSWVVTGDLLKVSFALGVIACGCAAVGLLAFGWEDRRAQPRTD